MNSRIQHFFLFYSSRFFFSFSSFATILSFSSFSVDESLSPCRGFYALIFTLSNFWAHVVVVVVIIFLCTHINVCVQFSSSLFSRIFHTFLYSLNFLCALSLCLSHLFGCGRLLFFQCTIVRNVRFFSYFLIAERPYSSDGRKKTHSALQSFTTFGKRKQMKVS